VEAGLAVDQSAGDSIVSLPGPINEATGPIELLEPGRERDGVRLLVTSADGKVAHADFTDFPEFLSTGDVVVVNDSATIPAALPAQLGRKRLRLHISSAVPSTSRRLVELRLVEGLGSVPYGSAKAGDIVRLPGAARAVLVSPRLRVGKRPTSYSQPGCTSTSRRTANRFATAMSRALGISTRTRRSSRASREAAK
jgi:S-adenosylmethionine:tRNA ribosyltransferase-isomerase